MKTDKTKLLKDIETMKEKLASMEEELNKEDLAWYEYEDNFRMAVKQIKSFNDFTDKEGELEIMEKFTDDNGISVYVTEGYHTPLQWLECFRPATESEVLSLVYKPQQRVSKENTLAESDRLMEKELNKPEEFKHFPSTNDKYYYYTPIGVVWDNTAPDNDLRVNIYKTKEEAKKAYNKAVAVEKVKRKLLELQGDWKPDWSDKNEEKFCIQYDHYDGWFKHECWYKTQQDSSIPYMKDERIAGLIIYELDVELKLIFGIA